MVQAKVQEGSNQSERLQGQQGDLEAGSRQCARRVDKATKGSSCSLPRADVRETGKYVQE